MVDLKGKLKEMITQIYEYQRHVVLSRRFIHELESVGADTSSLRAEISELEEKIRDLQLQSGHYS